MKAIFRHNKKTNQATLTVTVDNVDDIIANSSFNEITHIVAERFAEEYYAELIKKIDSKALTTLIMIEVAKKAVS